MQGSTDDLIGRPEGSQGLPYLHTG